MLNIIYGTESTDRDNLAYDFLQKATQEKPAWLLVPEQFSLSAEKLIIKKYGISSQTRIKVITFSRLCNLILSHCGPMRMQYIDGAGKQIIAARTIRAIKDRISVLAPNLKRKGFATTIVDIVSEFKRYGVSGEMLQALAEGDDELSRKISDISVILETFNGFLEKEAADAEDNLELVCPKIKDCDFLHGSLVIMHFRSFTPVEHRVLGELMKKMDVYAAMCCDGIRDGSSLFDPVAYTCRALIETAEEIGIPCLETEANEKEYANGELYHLQKNYFASRPVPYPGNPDNVKFFEVSGTYREVEAAADLILNLCRTENRKFSDFIILARDTASYNRIMPAIFSSRGIDVFLDTRRSILSKPFCEMLCAAMDILSFGYSYDRVMTIARSGIIDVPDGDIDMFENYLLAVNPTHAMWGEEIWEYCPKGYDIKTVNRTRHKLLDFVEKISSQFSGRKTARQICAVLLSVMKEEQLAKRTEEICDSFANSEMPYLADEYRQVWNSVISVLTQISTLMDDENITWQDFAGIFKNACAGLSVGLTPQTQGSVTFSQIDRFRNSDTPVVIVLGMTDGVFPKAHTSEGLLSDAERSELLKSGIQLAPGADVKRHEEQMLIYSVLTAATEKLYFFSPLASSDGKQLEPSVILKRIKSRIFPDIQIFNPDFSGDYLRFSEGRSASFDILCTAIAECGGDTDKLCEAGKALYEYFADVPEFAQRMEKIIKNMNAPDSEKLSKESVKAIYGETILLSASKLEKYNACAFSYFMNYGLLAMEREKAGIESKSTGTIQHAALYRYFSELKENESDYSDIDKESCYEKIYSIVKDEALHDTELLYESSSYYKYVVTRMQGIAARTAWEVVKFFKSSRFRPMGLELRIGTGKEIPAIEIKDSDNVTFASLSGIIDRADTAVIDGKTYVSIIDYKSSVKTLDERLVAAGINLQPLLYSDIVCRRLNANPAAMLYMQMTDPIVDEEKLKGVTYGEIEKAVNGKISLGGWLANNAEVIASYSSGGENGEKFIPSGKAALVGEKELQERIDTSNKKIRESAFGIYEGNVTANPYIDKGYNACSYCPYGSSCNYNK